MTHQSKMKTFSEKMEQLKKNDKFWFRRFYEKNTYFDFIENVRHIENQSIISDGTIEGSIHIHHIIPKYLLKGTKEEIDYCDSKENLIALSLHNHKQAHILFHANYPDIRHKGAIDLLNGSMTKAARAWKQAGAYASHQVQKKLRGQIFSIEHQKKAAANSLARPDAFKIRSKGGKKGGRKTQENRVVTATDKFVWLYEKKKVLCTFNCKTGQDILDELNQYKQTNMIRVSPVLRKTRYKAYGWSCLKCDK
jgi:hypothetical protein